MLSLHDLGDLAPGQLDGGADPLHLLGGRLVQGGRGHEVRLKEERELQEFLLQLIRRQTKF